jgi:hypothetical protein
MRYAWGVMRIARILVKCVIAGVLLSTGTLLLVLPGPGIPLIAAGVAVLATEFEWAAKLQNRAISAWKRLWQRPAAVRA